MKTNAIVLAAAALYAYQPATASMDIAFVESAPKDWFSLTNNSTCTLERLTLSVDLSNTAGKLIFDTTSAGEGVEVFQPFEKREGDVRLTSAEKVLDGEKTLSVLIQNLSPGQSVSFTIDVDDTLAESELGNIRVSGSEIEGGVVSLSMGSLPEVSSTFDSKATATLPSPICTDL